MGAGNVYPKPKKRQHLRAYPTGNPVTSPAWQKNPAPVTLNWNNSGEPTGQVMNRTIKKGRIGVGSLENASYMKTPCTHSKVKLQARAMVHTSPLQDYR